ncbi:MULTISPECIES: hypothetical protein [unclassified Streptomyces]|uniref:hypothetical protein n=1 Tax=unclassified Streptomyces TaxID=2593676 RepID=UPI001F2DE7F5|nr:MULTISPECIES: hypothetical protein [unclassified Streptomyces]MCF0086642.1 hypothetical protein [Streptomyces sp. MH192]MCF0098796.1 hypothetical protein [Streptomyces sp. MH191]
MTLPSTPETNVPAMTPAPTRTEADYYTLPATSQDRFNALMEQADTAGPHDYPHLMTALALLTGIRGEIRRCSCSCICGHIFDADDPDAHVIEYGDGYNLGRHQCPWCADQHPQTD